VPRPSPAVSALLLTLAIGAGIVGASLGFWNPSPAAVEMSAWLLLPFFVLIGIELRREFSGDRKLLRGLVAPALSALFGGLLPALVVLGFGSSVSAAWPVPVATDLTLALAVFSLATKSVSNRWRTYLLAFAVFDDIFGILALNASKPGLSPSLIGVAIGLVISPRVVAGRVEALLALPVNYLIVPTFGLVASAVSINPPILGALFAAVALRPAAKLIGISSGYAIARLLKVQSRQRHELTWIASLGVLGGIGFVVSFAAANQVFSGHAQQAAEAKLATLFAALVSALVGFLLVKRAVRLSSAGHGTDARDGA
jgi:NhaA family Na+:H+ antiporter